MTREAMSPLRRRMVSHEAAIDPRPMANGYADPRSRRQEPGWVYPDDQSVCGFSRALAEFLTTENVVAWPYAFRQVKPRPPQAAIGSPA